jgi:hypothetical protein
MIYILADGAPDPNTTRAMGLVPVNAPQATSVVGHRPAADDEFTITRLNNRLGMASGGHQVQDHRGNIVS